MSGLDELKALEKQMDDAVSALTLLQLPLNTVLATAYVVIDGLFHGSRDRIAGTDARVAAGYASASRLSYLLPTLAKCPTIYAGETVADSVTALSETQWGELRLLFQYGHYCELMPEVHRGRYAIIGGGRDYALEFASPAAKWAEARDIVLNELALPFYVSPKTDDAVCDELAAALPRLNLKLLKTTFDQFFRHYTEHTYEAPLLSDVTFRVATGASYSDFCLFRCGWVALADLALGIAAAVTRKAQACEAGGERDSHHRELVEWVAVALNSQFLSDLLMATAGLERAKFDALMRFFSINAKEGKLDHAGDGFYPPITEFDGVYQFNPDVVRVMLSGRNVPYALNRVDKKKFDDEVSHDLEPQLLRAASPLFARIADTRVIANYAWGGGEADLLVYSASANTVPHVQAKAALPPQGARMVDRVESRSLEGLRQLKAFRLLTAARRDQLLSAAFEQRIEGVIVADVLLCRAGIGTHKIWSQLGDVLPLNLPLLQAIVDALAEKRRSLAEFRQTGQELLDEVCDAVIQNWTPTALAIHDVTLTVPILNLEHATLNTYRLRWHPR